MAIISEWKMTTSIFLILNIMRPKHEAEWIITFHLPVKFTNTPQCYVFDIDKWKWMYCAIVMYT